MSKSNISVETKGWRILVLSEIRTDAGCQPRSGIVDEVVEDYHAHLSHGGDLPPVAVFYDGSEYYLADGYHRFAAHDRAGLKRINAIITQGTLREAVLYSLGANQTHGLRRSNEDKRRAVERMFGDDEWRNWSDAKIADHIGVSQSFVRDLRPPTSHKLSSDEPERRLGRDGRMRSASRKPKASGVTRTSEYSQTEPDYQEKFRQINEDTESAGVPLPREAASAPPHSDAKAEIGVVTEQNPERAAVADLKPKPPEAHWNADDGAESFSETNAWLSEGADPRHSGPEMQSQANPAGDTGGAGGSPATDEIDITAPNAVHVQIRADSRVVWVNVDGSCRLRCCQIGQLQVIDERDHLSPPHDDGMVAYWVDPDDPASLFANGLAMAMRASRAGTEQEPSADFFAAEYPADMPLRSGDLNMFCDWLLEFEAAFRARYKHGNAAALRSAE
jgi:hypothetical protein